MHETLPISKAIGYARNQREALKRFREDGRLPIHNHWSEGALRREAVGWPQELALRRQQRRGGEVNAALVTLLAWAHLTACGGGLRVHRVGFGRLLARTRRDTNRIHRRARSRLPEFCWLTKPDTNGGTRMRSVLLPGSYFPPLKFVRTLSMRRRLGFIAVFAVLLAAAFFAAFIAMRTAIHDRLVERAAFEAERALARLTTEVGGPSAAAECSAELSVSSPPSAGAGVAPPAGVDAVAWARLLDTAAARSASEPAVALLDRAGAPLMVAVGHRGDGALVWAAVAVVDPPELLFWRLIALGFAAAVGLLLVAAIDAVVVVHRAAARLGGAALELAVDLDAPIPRIGVRELEGVAESLRTMAGGLRRARVERDGLHVALERRERLAALGRVIAGVAHEVRNPLAAIKLLADLIREGGTEADRARDLGRLTQEVDHLDHLVSDLLVFTRGPPRAPVIRDVAALAAERASLLSAWAEQRRVTLRTTGFGRATIDLDGTTRALDNLLRNAVEASPPDRVVDVEVGVREGMVEVCVCDDGPGIPEARTVELFEPFFTTKPSGTGLGLALARAVARAHGGDLTFQRTLGRTQFTLRFADAQ